MFPWEELRLENVGTIVDVGAAAGNFLAPACARYQPKRWVAIDMLRDKLDVLQSRADLDQTIGTVIYSAVGDVDKVGRIGRTVSAESSSLLPINPQSSDWFEVGQGGMEQSDAGAICIRRLDALLADVPGDIDLMKIDVQGYEGRLIQGGQESLKRTKAVIIEVLFVQHYYGQSTPAEIEDGLSALGFKRRLWLNEARDKVGDLTQRDGFYVRN